MKCDYFFVICFLIFCLLERFDFPFSIIIILNDYPKMHANSRVIIIKASNFTYYGVVNIDHTNKSSKVFKFAKARHTSSKLGDNFELAKIKSLLKNFKSAAWWILNLSQIEGAKSKKYYYITRVSHKIITIRGFKRIQTLFR